MELQKLAIFLVFLNQKFYLAWSSGCGSDLQKKILSQIFFDYNNNVRPPPGDNATIVTANAAILNINSVDEKAHQWKVDLFFRQQWNDPRLQYTNLVLNCRRFQYLTLITEDSIKKLWKPNLFFTTEIEGTIHNVLQPNILIRIFPNGDVLYSVHAAVTLYCTGAGSRPGEFLCPLSLYPYGPTKDEIVLRWLAKDAIQIDRTHILLDEHIIGDITTRVEDFVSITGTYSMLVADFHLLKKTCMA